MTKDACYADTAYDSRKKKNVSPPDPALRKDRVERWFRSHPLPLGVNCSDLRFFADTTMAPAGGDVLDLLTFFKNQTDTLVISGHREAAHLPFSRPE